MCLCTVSTAGSVLFGDQRAVAVISRKPALAILPAYQRGYLNGTSRIGEISSAITLIVVLPAVCRAGGCLTRLLNRIAVNVGSGTPVMRRLDS